MYAYGRRAEIAIVPEVTESGPPAIKTGDAPPTPRIVAPGGWRRALVGFLLGVGAGALLALVLPRDEGPRRRRDPHELPSPFVD